MIEATDDRSGQNHLLNKLIKPGIVNTEQVTREYQFTYLNELDAITLYGFNIVGTKTMSALPLNTISVHFHMEINHPSNAYMMFYRDSSGSTQRYVIGGYGIAVFYISCWLPTKANTIYVAHISNVVNTCRIIGYKVKE